MLIFPTSGLRDGGDQQQRAQQTLALFSVCRVIYVQGEARGLGAVGSWGMEVGDWRGGGANQLYLCLILVSVTPVVTGRLLRSIWRRPNLRLHHPKPHTQCLKISTCLKCIYFPSPLSIQLKKKKGELQKPRLPSKQGKKENRMQSAQFKWLP